MSDSANNNSRITLRMIYDEQRKMFDLYHTLNTKTEVQENRLDTHRTEIDALRKKSNIWDTANVVLIAIGTFLGYKN